LLSVLFYGLLITPVWGQKVTEVYPQQSSIEHNPAVKTFSKDFVSTLSESRLTPGAQYPGNEFNNIALVEILGSDNITALSQQGYDITGSVNVVGNKNHTAFSQTGSDLYSMLRIEGNLNEFDMRQYGSGLQNDILLRGTDTNFGVYQDNFGLNISQTGMGTIPLSIRHTGRAVPIIIENN